MSAVFIAEAPARDAVAAGARLLDQLDAAGRHHGADDEDWDTRVDPARLDVDHSRLCPLAQSYGDFFAAPVFDDLDVQLLDLLLRPDEVELQDLILRAQILGFWSLPTPGEEDDEDDPGDRDELNRRWREEIRGRAAVRHTAWMLAA